MNQSVWNDTITIPGFPSLNGDKKTDVLIIGGGMCGILCAYFLHQTGVNYILAEGNRIGGKITGNTTAKLTIQHGLIYDKLIKSIGLEAAQMYLGANLAGLKEFARLCAANDCDYEKKSAYTYTISNRSKLEQEITAYGRLGIKTRLKERLPIPIQTAGAVELENQAQFHPLKFIKEISKDLSIYEQTFVTAVDGHTAVYDRGKIMADQIIVATHFPFINTHGSYFLKMYQHRSYVIALSNAPEINGMYVDEAEKGMSFRNYGGLLFIGGGAHRTGMMGGSFGELRRFAQKEYPGAKEQYAWAAQDCMTLDKIPYIGHYSKHTPYMYTATGFEKWGMTTSMAAAKILTDMVTGKTPKYAPVFSPHRSMLKPQLLINGAKAAGNLLTPSKKRCPHLGCALKWNPAEHTWDCPCHGSRFEKDGKLVDNPAQTDAKV